MIDHVGLAVRDFDRSKTFYAAALAPLGYSLIAELEYGTRFAGFGERGKPDFWIEADDAYAGEVHVAFACKDRPTVDAFHAAALAAGGLDNGKPGLRPEYHANYYGAFVRDPDGHNVEAVCHKG